MKKLIIFLLIIGTISGCKDDCETIGNCALAPDTGFCDAAFPRYYFDSETGECKEFIWGGCEGVVPFETMEECSICECN